MSGFFSTPQETIRIECPMKCGAIIGGQHGTQCGSPAFNALYCGHDAIGKPYIIYLCDYCETERPKPII